MSLPGPRLLPSTPSLPSFLAKISLVPPPQAPGFLNYTRGSEESVLWLQKRCWEEVGLIPWGRGKERCRKGENGCPGTRLLWRRDYLPEGRDSAWESSVGSVRQLVQSPSRVRLFATPWTAARFPVHHQLPELAQTHVHWVSDAIQPSHPLSSPSPAFSLSQYQGLF